MQITRYYKTYATLKKELLQKVGIYSSKSIKIRCYTSIDENILATDLELEIYAQDGEFLDSITVASIETNDAEDWRKTTDEQRLLLLIEKNKVYHYLKDKFPNVLSANDYSF